jgi:excisionase family DNA binding protein
MSVSASAELLTEPVRDSQAALLDVAAVARLLHCSERHVYRLADSGKMPPPIRLGSLVRWSRQAVENWISEGCPRVQS